MTREPKRSITVEAVAFGDTRTAKDQDLDRAAEGWSMEDRGIEWRARENDPFFLVVLAKNTTTPPVGGELSQDAVDQLIQDGVDVTIRPRTVD